MYFTSNPVRCLLYRNQFVGFSNVSIVACASQDEEKVMTALSPESSPFSLRCCTSIIL